MKGEELRIPYQRIDRSELSDIDFALEKAALEAAKSAYAPYSNFFVGAAALLANGEILAGSNQENAAYPSGICAERTLIYYAGSKYPNVAIKKIVLVALSGGKRVELITPCGACRQVMMETASRFAPFEVLMMGADNGILLSDNRLLLPFAFDGSDLPKD